MGSPYTTVGYGELTSLAEFLVELLHSATRPKHALVLAQSRAPVIVVSDSHCEPAQILEAFFCL